MSRCLSTQSNNDYERLGFVFPVYAWGPPSIVTKFLKKLKNIKRNTYVFCAVTYRKEPGAVIKFFSNLLKKKGLKLNAGFEVCMPGNHIANYEIDSEKMQEKKFDKWKLQLPKITSILRNKNDIKIKKASLYSRIFLTGFLYKIAVRQFSKADNKFFISDTCNGCGVCAEVCPTTNIAIKDSKPVWKHNCEQCLACLHWCPQQAIEFGEDTVGRERYQNPHVILEDLMKKQVLVN